MDRTQQSIETALKQIAELKKENEQLRSALSKKARECTSYQVQLIIAHQDKDFPVQP